MPRVWDFARVLNFIINEKLLFSIPLSLNYTMTNHTPLKLADERQMVQKEEIKKIDLKEPDSQSSSQSYQEYCRLYFTNIILTNQVIACPA
jgi:hypothetical protein